MQYTHILGLMLGLCCLVGLAAPAEVEAPPDLQKPTSQSPSDLKALHQSLSKIKKMSLELEEEASRLSAQLESVREELRHLDDSPHASEAKSPEKVIIKPEVIAPKPVVQVKRPSAVVAPKPVPKPASLAPAAPSRHDVQVRPKVPWWEDPLQLLRIGGGLVGFALLMLLVALWPRRRRMPPSQQDPSDMNRSASNMVGDPQVLDDEYDFMNSEDALPVRFDLARVYLEMGKYQQAKEALTLVFEKGTPEQITEASSLLRQIQEMQQSDVMS